MRHHEIGAKSLFAGKNRETRLNPGRAETWGLQLPRMAALTGRTSVLVQR